MGSQNDVVIGLLCSAAILVIALVAFMAIG